MLPELTRINSIFENIISMSDVDYAQKDILCSQASKITGKDNVNIQIQIVNIPKIVEAAKAGIEEIKNVSNNSFQYDNTMSWRGFTAAAQAWYYFKRLEECSNKEKLANMLGLSHAAVYRIARRVKGNSE